MNQNQLNELHQAAQLLLTTIEKYSGEKGVVMYGTLSRTNTSLSSGITCSEDIEPEDLADILFRFAGRAYKMSGLES